jgi:hypothetical protein
MNRRSGTLLGAGFVLLIGCTRQESAQNAPPAGEQRPPALVDIATDSSDPGHFADTEPSIAVNPANPLDIAVVTFSEPWGPGEKAPVWRSSDGGRTWRKDRILPQIDPGFGGPADQQLVFSSSGKLFLVTLGVDASNLLRNKIIRTGGTAGEMLPGGGFGDDQPQLGLHRTPGTCATRIYAAWLDTRNGSKSMVTASVDEGENVESALAGHTPPNRTTRLAVGQNEAYVIFKTRLGRIDDTFEKAQMMVRRTDDCGKSWNGLGPDGVSVTGSSQVSTLFTNEFGNKQKGKVARARSSDAWIATAPDGAVYAVYVNKDSTGFAQLFVARSSDRGQTWTLKRLTDGRHHSAYPAIAVAANGTVGVLYVDFDDSGSKTIFRHRFARSFDLGQTWSDETLQSLDPSALDNADDGFLWGDYQGLTAEGTAFYGVFSGESIGRPTKEMDPIFFTRPATR